MGYNQEGMTDEDINWDAAGNPVPVGEYDVEVVQATHSMTKNNKHMISVQLKIETAYDAENESSVDRMLFENFVFTQNAAFRVKQFAKAGNVDLPNTINKPILEEWAGVILGTKVKVAVKHREWEGEMRANVAKFEELGSGEVVEEEQQDADADAEAEPEQEEEQETAPPEPPKKSIKAATQGSIKQKTNGTAKAPSTAKQQQARR